MKNVYVLGLTGGVGAGKSTVIGYLKEHYGATILISDMIAAKMMEPGGPTYDGLVEIMGSDVLSGDKPIDKRAMAAKLFVDASIKKRVNELVHPIVVAYIKARIEAQELEAIVDREGLTRYVVVESALIFEGGASGLCDQVWYIRTPDEVRINRLMESRGYSREKCLSIIAAQNTDEYFMDKCDVVIENDGDTFDTYNAIDVAIKNLEELEE